jgi:glutamate-1-semialdehyde 2,1-aminomutase
MTEAVASPNALLERAVSVLPGGASGSWRAMDAEVIERAAGQYVWTEGGRRYLDHVLAWGTIVVGHCDPRVNRAVEEMAATCDLTTVGPQRGEVELAEQICMAMPCAEQVAFCLSGTEASLHAVQLLRARTGRKRLLKFHGSYHGWHDMLAVGVRAAPGRESHTDLRDRESAGIHPDAAADVTVVEWNDLDGLRDALAAEHDDLAAVFCEPYVQSYGCVPAAPGFLETLRELCTRYGVPLVFDEVKTAFRHHLGGFQAICGVTPDLAIFSKALGNGYAIGGLGGTRELMSGFVAGDASGAVMDGTGNASPYAMAAGSATFAMLRDGGVERLAELGERMRSGLRGAIADSGARACVAGVGGSWAVYMREEAPRNYREALDQDATRMDAYNQALRRAGILEPIVALGDRRLCVAATENDVDDAIVAARTAFREVK